MSVQPCMDPLPPQAPPTVTALATMTQLDTLPSSPASRDKLTLDATATIPLSITFGTSEGFETFRKHVREDQHFLDLNSSSLTDWWLVKYFDGARGNPELAIKMLEKTLQWRIDYNWSNLRSEDFSDDHATGKLSFQNHAKDGTPILVWRICRHKADPKKVDHTVRFIVYMMEKGIREGIITSRLTLLIDRVGSTNENVEGIAFFRSLTYVLQTHFPEMLQRLVIFPTNWLLWTVWKVVKPFLDASVVERLSLLGPKEYKQTLQDLIAPEHLSPRFGGRSVDWTETDGVVHAEDEEDDDGGEGGKMDVVGRDSGVSVSTVGFNGILGGNSKKKNEAERPPAKSGAWGMGKMRRMFKDSKDTSHA